MEYATVWVFLFVIYRIAKKSQRIPYLVDYWNGWDEPEVDRLERRRQNDIMKKKFAKIVLTNNK